MNPMKYLPASRVALLLVLLATVLATCEIVERPAEAQGLRSRRCRGLRSWVCSPRRRLSHRACKCESPAAEKKPKVTSLFDGKTLGGWKITNFGTQGEVKVKDGAVILGYGDGCTGVTCTHNVPRMNYEISLEAKRVDGGDFFCGLTFPVAKSPCTFIVGGWGGGVVGLSSIDGYDASENETTKYRAFKNGKWYAIRVRVTKDKIEAWIDGKKMVNTTTIGRKLSVRAEVELSRPLGITSWCTTAALRNIQVRPVTAPDSPPDDPTKLQGEPLKRP